MAAGEFHVPVSFCKWSTNKYGDRYIAKPCRLLSCKYSPWYDPVSDPTPLDGIDEEEEGTPTTKKNKGGQPQKRSA